MVRRYVGATKALQRGLLGSLNDLIVFRNSHITRERREGCAALFCAFCGRRCYLVPCWDAIKIMFITDPGKEEQALNCM